MTDETESSKEELSMSSDPLLSGHTIKPQQRWHYLSTRHIIVFSLALHLILFIVLSIGWSFVHVSELNERACTTLLSSYSPAIEAVEYEWVQWPNRFRQESIFRGKPTSVTEEAWYNITLGVPNFGVPISRLPDLRKGTTRKGSHTNKAWLPVLQRVDGGPFEESIAAELEVTHQLHCLHLIRRYTYRDVIDYSDDPEWALGPDILREHVDHCIETLRIALMCFGDTTPVLFYENEFSAAGSSDFETLHRCKKWETLVDWVDDNAVIHF